MWEWRGATRTWRKLAPVTSPPARYGHALAFDKSRGEMLLFGGIGLSGEMLDDTWIWNATAGDWSPREVLTHPSRRIAFGLAYDASRSQVVLYGGLSLTGRVDDTWAWNGAVSTWSHRAPVAFPVARYSFGFAYDARQHEIVLFGGQTTVATNDTWLHRTLGSTCTTSADCIETSSCVDGVCCESPSCGTCRTCSGTSPGHCAPVINEEDLDTCAARDGKSCSRLGECRGALGVPAIRPGDCASGYVVDGVCCASATCGTCTACNVALKERDEVPGICTATRDGTDPRNECSDEGAASCGTNGACDGNNRCAFYGAGTTCGVAGEKRCSGAGRCLEASGASCDGDHTVIAPDGTRTDCGAFKCAGSACNSTCSSENDCAGTADCTPDHVCTAFGNNHDPTSDQGCRGARRDDASSAGQIALLAMAAALRARRRRAR